MKGATHIDQISSSQPFSENILPCDGEAYFIDDDSPDFDWPAVTKELIANVPWNQERVRLFGRSSPLPRLTAWFSDQSYSYSGVDHPPAPLPELIERLRCRAETLSSAQFNSVLLNLYRDGSDRVGWHSDNERGLGPTPTIASLSLGGARRFQFRHRTTKETVSIELKSGCWVIMAGATQRHWQHQVPRTARPVEPRVNLTFRYMNPNLLTTVPVGEG